MLWKTSGLLGLFLITGISSKALGQSIENTVNSESQPIQEQSLDNDQNNAAAINQTGVYNIGEAATYKIQGLGGRQVVCPRPSFILGTGYNSYEGINFSENASYALNASFIVPLGGKISETCQNMAETIATKTQYDLEIINARSCAELLGAGVALNPEQFPTLFSVCQGVSLVKNNSNQPSTNPLPPTRPLPIVPPESQDDDEDIEGFDGVDENLQGSRKPRWYRARGLRRYERTKDYLL